MSNRRSNKKRRQAFRYLLTFIAGMVVGALALFVVYINKQMGVDVAESIPVKQVPKPEITAMLLTPNPYSRPQKTLDVVNGVVVHYVANPSTSAQANRNYFEQLKDGTGTSASSHFIIGLDGEIIQCVPLNEIAYASNERNSDTISIECCHPDKSGKFNEKTYQSLIKLTSWLCGKYNLKESKIIRHYDVTGKLCPKYYVEHGEAWSTFKKNVTQYIDQNGIEP